MVTALIELIIQSQELLPKNIHDSLRNLIALDKLT